MWGKKKKKKPEQTPHYMLKEGEANKFTNYPYTSGSLEFWQGIANKYHKDTGGVVDPDDPEYSAQKIYTHYLNSFGILKKAK